jgi:hypothetical protein
MYACTFRYLSTCVQTLLKSIPICIEFHAMYIINTRNRADCAYSGADGPMQLCCLQRRLVLFQGDAVSHRLRIPMRKFFRAGGRGYLPLTSTAVGEEVQWIEFPANGDRVANPALTASPPTPTFLVVRQPAGRPPKCRSGSPASTVYPSPLALQKAS